MLPRCILNMKAARLWALACGEESHPGQFQRVSPEWLSELEEQIKCVIAFRVRAIPSKGKTIK